MTEPRYDAADPANLPPIRPKARRAGDPSLNPDVRSEISQSIGATDARIQPVAQQSIPVGLITSTEARQDTSGSFGTSIKRYEEPNPTWSALLRAAYEGGNTQFNTLMALEENAELERIRQEARISGEGRPSFDPYDHIQGYEDWAEYLGDVESPQEFAWWKRKIERENRINETLASGGWRGWAAMIIMGAIDPINYIPVIGQVGKSASLGLRVLQSAKQAAIAGGVSSAASEAVLQQAQVTRTAEESALSIGAGAVLSGLLGGAAPLVKEALPSMRRQLAKDLGMKDDIPYTDVWPDPVFRDPSIRELSDPTPRLGEQRLLRGPPEAVPEPEVSVPAGETSGSAGAMKASEREARLKSSLGLAETVSFSVPGLRTAVSESAFTRRLAQALDESGLAYAAEPDGSVPPVALWTRVKMWNADLAQTQVEGSRLYAEYRGSVKGQPNRLSRLEFFEEVSRAMRNNDTHVIPQVQEMASINRKLANKLKEASIELDMLKADVKAVGKDSYLSRVYNIPEIIAQRPEFEKKITRWLMREQAKALKEAQEKLAQNPQAKVKMPEVVDENEMKLVARDITSHILGAPDGRIPYEAIPLTRGPHKELVLNIMDKEIEDFLENDSRMLMEFMTHTMAPDIELVRLDRELGGSGRVDLQDQFAKIREDYARKVERAKSEKERTALHKAMENDIKDLSLMRDRARGTASAPADPNSFGHRALSVIHDWNYISSLGSAVMQSISDIAQPVLKHGLLSVFGDGIVPLIKDLRGFKLSMREGRLAGAALDLIQGNRAKEMGDLGSHYSRHSKAERFIKGAANRFGAWNLMNPWNFVWRSFSSVITQHEVLQAAVAGASRTPKQIERLRFLNISPEMADDIAKEFRKHGKTGDVWLANTEKWDNKDAVFHYRAALLKNVDRTIFTPGIGDRPNWATSLFGSKDLGRTVFQFRGFTFTAMQRMTIAGLQQRDMAVLNGMLLAVTLGMLSYYLAMKAKGKEPSDNPGKWVIEGIDRSGILAWFFEVHNVVEKLTHGRVGLNALVGGEPSFRYGDRNVSGALFGPTIGRIEDVAKITGGISDYVAEGEIRSSAIHAARRAIWGQNVFYARWLFDEAEEGIANSIGATK